MNDPAFLKDTLVIVTFDECDDYNHKNQIYTVLVGGGVIPGSSVTSMTNHYSILKLIEDHFELGNLGRGDVKAKAITGIWQ